MTSYDMSKPRQRMGLYRAVLHEGLRDDLPSYLNQDLLIQLVAGAARPGRSHRAHCVGGHLPPARLPHPGSRVMDMPELHTRLLANVIALGSPYPLVLTGGYARTSTSPPRTRYPWPMVALVGPPASGACGLGTSRSRASTTRRHSSAPSRTRSARPAPRSGCGRRGSRTGCAASCHCCTRRPDAVCA